MKIIKNIIEFIIRHTIISMLITGLVITFFLGQNPNTMEWNFLGGYIMSGFIYGILAPFINKARSKRERKEEIDYLAKRLAEEQKK